jgi:hypothetical protein
MEELEKEKKRIKEIEKALDHLFVFLNFFYECF